MKKLILAIGFAALGLSYNAGAQTTLSQNFEGVTVPSIPATWTQVGSGWVTTNTPTNLYFGTVPANSTYALVNDFGSPAGTNNSLDQLVSSTFSIGSGTPYLKYDYVYFGAYTNGTPSDSEHAYIDLSINGGTSWTTIEQVPPIGTATWTSDFVSLAAYAGSPNCKLRVVYKDGGGDLIGVAIDNIQVYNATSADMAITAMTPQAGSPGAYGLAGGSITLGATIANLSNAAVSTYTVNYSIDGGTVVSNTVNQSVAAFASTPYSTSCTVPSVGNHSVKMWVTVAADADHTNDSGKTTIVGVSFMPTKKLVVEEATGSWCGWCVRGIVYMDSLRTLYGSGVSLIAVHDADEMSAFSANTGAYDAWISAQIGGYPSVIIDRRIVDDPQNLLDLYTEHYTDFGFADIAINGPTVTGTTITVPVSVKPALDLSGDYRLAMVITEDDVHGTSAAWDQHNYYSSQSQNQPLTGQGVNYQALPQIIPAAQMYYQFVDRSITPSVTGGTGLLPASMTAGSTYTYTFSNVSFAGVVREKMHAIIMLINGTNGQVMNSQSVSFSTAVPNVSAGLDNVILFPNPAATKATVNFSLDHSSDVTVNVTDMTGRIVSTTNSKMEAGNQQVAISTANFAAGNYNVTIQTDKGLTTLRLTVEK